MSWRDILARLLSKPLAGGLLEKQTNQIVFFKEFPYIHGRSFLVSMTTARHAPF